MKFFILALLVACVFSQTVPPQGATGVAQPTQPTPREQLRGVIRDVRQARQERRQEQPVVSATGEQPVLSTTGGAQTAEPTLREQLRDVRQERRQDRRDERQEGRQERRQGRQEGRQEGRMERRDERQEGRQERREDRQDQRVHDQFDQDFEEGANILMRGSVLRWTNGLYSALQSLSPEEISQYFDQQSELKYMGREFEGEEIGMFAFLMKNTVHLDSWNYEIVGVDETKASSIVKVTGSGTFLATDSRADNIEQIHVIEWGLGVVDDLTIVPLSLNETLMAALPECELLGWKFVWALFAGGDIKEDSPAIRQLISDDFQLTVHIFPQQLLQQNVFSGPQGFVQAFNKAIQLGLGVNNDNKKDIHFKILYSSDTNVFMSIELATNTIFKNLTCSNGKFVKEDLFVANPVLPWNVLPPPKPSDEAIQGEPALTGVAIEQPSQPPRQQQQQQQQPQQPLPPRRERPAMVRPRQD